MKEKSPSWVVPLRGTFSELLRYNYCLIRPRNLQAPYFVSARGWGLCLHCWCLSLGPVRSPRLRVPPHPAPQAQPGGGAPHLSCSHPPCRAACPPPELKAQRTWLSYFTPFPFCLQKLWQVEAPRAELLKFRTHLHHQLIPTLGQKRRVSEGSQVVGREVCRRRGPLMTGSAGQQPFQC